jgi:hypothetical protein
MRGQAGAAMEPCAAAAKPGGAAGPAAGAASCTEAAPGGAHRCWLLAAPAPAAHQQRLCPHARPYSLCQRLQRPMPPQPLAGPATSAGPGAQRPTCCAPRAGRSSAAPCCAGPPAPWRCQGPWGSRSWPLQADGAKVSCGAQRMHAAPGHLHGGRRCESRPRAPSRGAAAALTLVVLHLPDLPRQRLVALEVAAQQRQLLHRHIPQRLARLERRHRQPHRQRAVVVVMHDVAAAAHRQQRQRERQAPGRGAQLLRRIQVACGHARAASGPSNQAASCR